MPKKLNSAQIQAVQHTNGPLLVVAGAGTGKTTILIERLSFLLKNKLAQIDEVLITTFTEKAAAEMEDRALKLLPYGYVDLWINTFHSFCERILREHALEIGLPTDFTVLSQTEQWILIYKHLDDFDLDYYRPLGRPTKFIHELIRHFSRLKDENISPAQYLAYAEELAQDQDAMLSGAAPAKLAQPAAKAKNRPAGRGQDLADQPPEARAAEAKRIIELANAYHTYNQLLLANNNFDFGDLITYTLKLFKERPNILNYWRQKFKFIMVDEFQDTNWSQYELVKILAAPKNNLMVVGDDDQSIYRFRGASMSNIMQFKDDYPQAKEVVLINNYRSGQKILDIAYQSIRANNPYRLEEKLKINKRLIAANGQNGQVECRQFENPEAEAAWVGEKIKQLHNNGQNQWLDFAVLVRANDEASFYLSEFARAGIPHQYVSSRGLYYKPIILDIIAYLKLLDNYHESTALYRALSMAPWRLSYPDVIELNAYARRKGCSLYEALRRIEAVPNISNDGRARAAKFLSFLSRHTRLAQKVKPSQLLVDLVHQSGILKEFDYDRQAEQFAYLNQFFKKIQRFEAAEPAASLPDFMRLIAMEQEAGESGSLSPSEEDVDTVKILTVHSAKGLEFQTVFVVGLADKKFPTIARREKIAIPLALLPAKLAEVDFSQSHLEEERRLFYVALTRARQQLFLSFARDYGGARERKPSVFLTEIGLKPTAAPKPAGQIKLTAQTQSAKAKAEPQKTLSLPNKFSFSQIEAYANCPWQYKFNFILKIPVQPKASFVFGRLLHNVLRDFFAQLLPNASAQATLFADVGSMPAQEPSLDDLLDLYQRHWQDDGYDNEKEKEKYRRQGLEILKQFYQTWQETKPAVLFVEKGFLVRFCGYPFKGSIDRIDRLPSGGVEIIDYKTGQPKEKINFNQKRQLLLYKIAVETLFGLKVERLSYYYLTNNSKVSFTSQEKDEAKLKEQVTKIIKLIESGDFPPKPGPLCAWCDFRDICQFRKT